MTTSPGILDHVGEHLVAGVTQDRAEERRAKATVVTVMCDTGMKYLKT
jgi:cysteine synthase